MALVRAVYDAYQLEQNNEVALGGMPGDTQPCGGDSGGPFLTRGADGSLTAYGVVSGGMVSRTLACAYGAVYASFSPEVLTFLRAALTWIDPCSTIPSAGVGEGTTARRCSTQVEGARRSLSIDCAKIGTTCEAQADGTIGCGPDAATDVARPPAVAPTGSRSSKPDPLAFSRRTFFAPGQRAGVAVNP